MDRRTENHRSITKPAVLMSSVLISSTLLSSLGGCQAIRDRRAHRAAEREAARELAANNPQPVQTEGSDSEMESQEEWIARIKKNQEDQSNKETSGDDSSGSEMTIVDDRPSAQDREGSQSDDPEIEIIESPKSSVFARKPKDVQSYEQAVEFHASGDLESALRELERAIALNPQFTLAFLEAGDIYLEMAEYEIAERQFARAVRAEPRNFMAQYRHGQVLHHLGQLEDANRAFLRALSIRPADYDANLGISIVLLELGRVEQSLPYGQRAVRSEPPSGRARLHLGNVYAAIDRHEEAVIEYQQAGELMDAPTAGLLLNMAESLNQLKRYAEMVGALEQLVRIDPDPIAYERMGSGLFRLKRYEESLEAFTESAQLDPTHYPAFNGIAVCELNQYLWSSKTDGGARERAVDAMRNSLRIERKQSRIVELLRRYSRAASTEN